MSSQEKSVKLDEMNVMWNHTKTERKSQETKQIIKKNVKNLPGG